MAANMIRTDTSPASSLAICDRDAGGCGWRSPIARTRDKALAWAEAHRREQHPAKASDADRKRAA